MLQAAEVVGWNTRTVEPLLLSEISENMQTFLSSGCDLIVINSFDAVSLAIPEDHPNQRFWFMYAQDETMVWENVWEEVYQIDQGSFLAGYLAAAMTRSGKVGIFGGQPIPMVLSFMNGFALGIDYYNRQHSASVVLLGWQAGGGPSDGLFTGFFDPELVHKITRELIASGANIIFPVAGEYSMLSASDAVLAENDVLVIGVDQDWAASHPEYAAVTLTSVVMKPEQSVYRVMEAITYGTFSVGLQVSNLENGGVNLAPFYTFDSRKAESVKAELEQIRRDIIAGKIQTR